MKETDFGKWLREELKKRGWNAVRLASKAGVGRTMMYDVLNGERSPAWEFCSRVAQGLEVSPVLVFQRAGLMPATGERENVETEAVPGMYVGVVPSDLVRSTVLRMGAIDSSHDENFEVVWATFCAARELADKVAKRMGWTPLYPQLREGESVCRAHYLIGVAVDDAGGEIVAEVLVISIDKKNGKWDDAIRFSFGSAEGVAVELPRTWVERDPQQLVPMLAKAFVEGYERYVAEYWLPPPCEPQGIEDVRREGS